MDKIAVALSGGVDSAVAAALLVKGDKDVIGVTMRLWQEPPYPDDKATVPPDDPVENAARVAEALNIPFHVIDVTNPFKELVVDRFIAEYSAGRTPNPCLYCNRHIKFDYLIHQAFELGAQRLATGHYARVRRAPDGSSWQLLKGIDTHKDQSYVLHMLGQQDLARVLFPLGELTKDQVRDLARKRRIPAANAQESQDLCFIPDNDYRRFLHRYVPQIFTPGPILDSSGRELGRHEGLAAYTIGQRSGIGIAAPKALYVLRIDVEQNALIVGPKGALGCKELVAQDVRWVSGQPPSDPISAAVKIRYKAHLAQAIVTPLPNARASVRFSEPLRDITPGQGVVFYDAEILLGGGVIVR